MFIKKVVLKQARQLVLFLADFLFPRECVVCFKEGDWLCGTCRNKLGFLPIQVCLLCGADSAAKVCPSHNWFIDRSFSAFSYHDEAVKRLIKLYKYHFSREAGEILANLLLDFLNQDSQQTILRSLDYWARQDKLIVLAVPLSKRRYRWRGFNQAELLAKIIANSFSWPFDWKNLVKIKHTKPQAELSALTRLKNLNKVFAWRGNNLGGQTVLLVDDVVTTGATLNEVARVLKAAGASRVYCLTLAHG